MSTSVYKDFARFRILSLLNIKSKRTPDKVLADIDKELKRICNSVIKGYTLSSHPDYPVGETYRPYKYFDITWSDISNEFDLNVVITRGSSSITITEENWTQFMVWCTKWKKAKPETIEQCEDVQFYLNWW